MPTAKPTLSFRRAERFRRAGLWACALLFVGCGVLQAESGSAPNGGTSGSESSPSEAALRARIDALLAAGKLAEARALVLGAPTSGDYRTLRGYLLNNPAYVEGLVRQLGADNFTHRRQAAGELMEAGRAALEPLARALEDSDAEIRAKAAELLVALRGRGFVGIQFNEQPSKDAPPVPQQQEMIDGDDGEVEGASATPVAPQPVFIPAPDVQVVETVDGMPGKEAGVQSGDRFLAVNGRAICGELDLLREVILAGPAKPSMLVLDRDGRKITIAIMLGRHPSDSPPVDLLAEKKAAKDAEANRRTEAIRNLLERPAEAQK